ncbi:putative F-box/FBD/LRR-repeat protein At1g78840 [Silene latifolia]|uniref:putative F-box/FBD/LRR-repeat protein At1g78840 n=1 Tax=Silene latifolia TaxID=37657 RepID=UPI003D77D9E8
MGFGENVAKVKRGSVDRISELPDFILHNILLILDTKEAGRASVLSKRWYIAWASIPVLFFHPLYFKVDEDIGDNDESEYGRLQRYVEFIDNTMRRYFMFEYRIRKMYLEITIDDEKLETMVDRWIDIAVLNQVEELEFEVNGEIEYEPPGSLFIAKSLSVLKCRNIVLPYYEILELVSLKHLSLEPFSVDKKMLQRIISSCPLIELDIKHEYLDEVSLPWARKVDGGVEGCGSGIVQSNLQTHSLQKFVYSSLGVDLSWPWNMNVAALRNLRKLEFSCTNITDDAVSEMTYGLIALESLTLRSCSRLKYVKISSISLKELQISACPDFWNVESPDSVTVDAPKLVNFSYHCNLETSLLLIRVADQCNAKFYPMVTDSLTTEWFVELKMFLMETKVFKSLKMDLCNSHQIEVEHDQLMNAGTGLPCKLRLLTLCGISDRTLTESSLVAFLDALFWCCHPDVLRISTNVETSASKLILSVLMEKVQCWKDPLESIEVECIESIKLFSYVTQLEIRIKLSWE